MSIAGKRKPNRSMQAPMRGEKRKVAFVIAGSAQLKKAASAEGKIRLDPMAPEKKCSALDTTGWKRDTATCHVARLGGSDLLDKGAAGEETSPA